MDPYSYFLVFRIMFETACKSPSYAFRCLMMSIIDKITLPPFRRTSLGWRRGEMWPRRFTYVFIRADYICDLRANLKRIKFMEKLKIISLYWFLGTPDKGAYVITDGIQKLQNRWVYEEVTKIVSPDRIAVRKSSAFGLPPQPTMLRVLKTTDKPPTFFMERSSIFLP